MLWNEGKAVDLVDESLEGAFPVQEALRCIQALLCTQEEPYDRLEMHSVIKMLEGEELILEPLRPAIPVYDDAASDSLLRNEETSAEVADSADRLSILKFPICTLEAVAADVPPQRYNELHFIKHIDCSAEMMTLQKPFVGGTRQPNPLIQPAMPNAHPPELGRAQLVFVSTRQYGSIGDVSINSGSVGTSSALNGREWVGDVKPKLPSLLQLKGSSTTSTAIHKLISADPVPHNTARISLSQFSYAILLNPAGPFTLLSNFSASLTADALALKSFAKEFCLNIRENEQLILTFSPATSPSRDSTYAFINGIEIISVPAGLSYFDGRDTGIQVVGQKSVVNVDHNTALEIVHRLSIRPNPVLSAGDFDGVFPTWAIENANKSRNDTWKVPVDVGFRYLTRLHFSEVGLKIAGNSDVVFKVLINEIIAQTNIDIAKESVENSIPRGLLAGIEVFKLSNPDNNLASPNPLPPQQDSPSWIIQILLSVLGRTNAMTTFAVTMLALVNIIVHKLRDIWEAGSSEEKNKPSARAERLCRRFSLAEIRLATRNFSDALFIGREDLVKSTRDSLTKAKPLLL
ncbi:Receptor-like protein kinase FERONIA [Sesamum angolense]|uniref:Receptor-like protein kinase FERONIA n=1 Tax=Sesamum angolense TaxID=2727404 RepID=A0AAE2BPP2_9LAMI|nr:Receptor-like protein kinase FERONIA [Sesamum angolense]